MWRMDSDNNKDCLNVQFYKDEIPMKPVGLTVSEFDTQHRGNFRFLESCHSFIQWLFPNREKGLNYQAPVLTKAEIAIMSADEAILNRVRQSLQLMLEFYGMSLITLPAAGGLAVCRNPATWDACIRNLSWSSHNWLRISRILKFLTDIGLEEEKMAYLRRLRYEVTIANTLSHAGNSYTRFWAGTIADEAARKAFLAFPTNEAELEAEKNFMNVTVQACAPQPAEGDAESFSSSTSSVHTDVRGPSNARSEMEETITMDEVGSADLKPQSVVMKATSEEPQDQDETKQ